MFQVNNISCTSFSGQLFQTSQKKCFEYRQTWSKNTADNQRKESKRVLLVNLQHVALDFHHRHILSSLYSSSISINPNSMSAWSYRPACRWTDEHQLGFCSGTRTDNRSIKHFSVACYVFGGCAPPTHGRGAARCGVATPQPLNKASAALQQDAEGERRYKLLWRAPCFHFSYRSRYFPVWLLQANKPTQNAAYSFDLW